MPAAPVFTEHQREIIRQLARGRYLEEIAADLGVHLSTVNAHVRKFERKLGVKGKRQIPAAYMEATGDNPYPQRSHSQ